MNRQFIFAAAAVLVIATAGEAAESHPLVGTWKRIAVREPADDEWQDEPKGLTTLKHITGTQFTFVAYSSDTNEIRAAFGGRITIDGEKYIESVDYGPKELLDLLGGQKQLFSWKIDGKVFTQSGRLSTGLSIGERWERVTAQQTTP